MRGDPLPGPDPDQPDTWFRDGEHVYEVGTYPALMPVFMTQGPTGLALWQLMGGAVALLLGRWWDRRWKVVVSRNPARRATMWHAVHVEFVGPRGPVDPTDTADTADTAEVAEARQVELLRTWTRGQFANAVPWTSLELARARRTSLAGRPAPGAARLAGYSLARLRARFCMVSAALLLVAGGLAVVANLGDRSVALGWVGLGLGVVLMVPAVVFRVTDEVARRGSSGPT